MSASPQIPAPPSHTNNLTYTKHQIATIRRETITLVGRFVPEMIHKIKIMPTQHLLKLTKRWPFNHDPIITDGVEISPKAKELLALGPQHIHVPRHPPIYELNVKIQSFINWVRGRKTYEFQPDTRKFKAPVKQMKFTDPLPANPEIELFIKLVLQDLYNVHLYNQRTGQSPYKELVWKLIFWLRYHFNYCVTIQDKGGKFVVLTRKAYEEKWQANARITGMILVHKSE